MKNKYEEENEQDVGHHILLNEADQNNNRQEQLGEVIINEQLHQSTKVEVFLDL